MPSPVWMEKSHRTSAQFLQFPGRCFKNGKNILPSMQCFTAKGCPGTELRSIPQRFAVELRSCSASCIPAGFYCLGTELQSILHPCIPQQRCRPSPRATDKVMMCAYQHPERHIPGSPVPGPWEAGPTERRGAPPMLSPHELKA